MEPAIKFSHSYPKLWSQEKAELLAVRIIDAQAVDINTALKEYDTFWYDREGPQGRGYYELPKDGKLIQLVFLGNLQIPFCTLRRYTKEKFGYYYKLIGKIFEVRVG